VAITSNFNIQICVPLFCVVCRHTSLCFLKFILSVTLSDMSFSETYFQSH
jgi:hypothetical protein